MSQQSERSFQSRLQKHIEEQGHYHFTPIPDSGLQARFAVPKVYDFFLSRQAEPHAVELKQVHGTAISFSLKEVRPHQEQNLLNVNSKGAYGWVFVHHVSQLGDRAFKRYGRKQFDALWVIPILHFIFARDADGLSSLEPHQLNKYGFLVGQGKDIFRLPLFYRAVAHYPHLLEAVKIGDGRK